MQSSLDTLHRKPSNAQSRENSATYILLLAEVKLSAAVLEHGHMVRAFTEGHLSSGRHTSHTLSVISSKMIGRTVKAQKLRRHLEPVPLTQLALLSKYKRECRISLAACH